MSLVITSQGYTNKGVYRVVIRESESPVDSLIESSSVTRFSKKQQQINDEIIPFIEDIEKEVRKLPQVKRMKFQKLITLSYAIILPFIPIEIASAESTQMNFPLISGKGNEFLPPEVMQILVKLILALGTLGVLLAIGCLMVAGAIRMLGNQKKAYVWSKDIISGLGQILLSPVIILILTTIVALLFSNVPSLNIFY